MSDEDRIMWDVGQATVRPPTLEEIDEMGAEQWQPPPSPPVPPGLPVDPSLSRDGLNVAVEEHGELGPVLVNADHDFTGPSDI